MADKKRNELHGSHSFFLCGEASNETGRFRGGSIQRGQGRPWHTILLARSSVLYLLRLVGAPCARLRTGNRFWRLPILRLCFGAPPLRIEPAALGFDSVEESEGDLRRGSARTVRRPRTGGVCRASARKRRGLQTAKPAWPTEDTCAWMERSGRKACAAGPQEVYKKTRPSLKSSPSPSLVFSFFAK